MVYVGQQVTVEAPLQITYIVSDVQLDVPLSCSASLGYSDWTYSLGDYVGRLSKVLLWFCLIQYVGWTCMPPYGALVSLWSDLVLIINDSSPGITGVPSCLTIHREFELFIQRMCSGPGWFSWNPSLNPSLSCPIIEHLRSPCLPEIGQTAISWTERNGTYRS